MRCRSGPVVDRAYLRVSASGAYVRVLSSLSVTSEAILIFSYNTHYKATLFRASGPGRRGFAVGSWKLNVSMELRFTQKTGTVSCVL